MIARLLAWWRRRGRHTVAVTHTKELVYEQFRRPSARPEFYYAEIAVPGDVFRALLDDATCWRNVRASVRADPSGKYKPGMAYIEFAVPAELDEATRGRMLDEMALRLGSGV